MRRVSVAAMLVASSIACTGRERINRDCQWTHDAAFRLDLRPGPWSCTFALTFAL
jgi:hypothetical protein